MKRTEKFSKNSKSESVAYEIEKVLLTLSKQTAMGASAAALESIGEILKAKARLWGAEALASVPADKASKK